ncbi:hypothetical protein FIBSPDRAFT_963579 [Athelia psychrophila]|uniref:Uncharacterized protein n=1 Tax=Athelia psychrophila TaxID=1759441 RepID=A0A165YTY3_9AGAM|nr:hypothetical protein FIBSPDRAFT_963579 [Fibularhizoctonia sp. CBS 109695]
MPNLKMFGGARVHKAHDLDRRVVDKMQPLHEIAIDRKEPTIKKGALNPMSVAAKVQQGKKVSTLISGFEPFLITVDVLAEKLRRLSVSATSGASLLSPYYYG